jgi:hypothetical protein
MGDGHAKFKVLLGACSWKAFHGCHDATGVFFLGRSIGRTRERGERRIK